LADHVASAKPVDDKSTEARSESILELKIISERVTGYISLAQIQTSSGCLPGEDSA
jgi:hypothetical protein